MFLNQMEIDQEPANYKAVARSMARKNRMLLGRQYRMRVKLRGLRKHLRRIRRSRRGIYKDYKELEQKYNEVMGFGPEVDQ